MRKLIIASGRKRSGKGTLFKVAEKLTKVEEFFFAKPLKDFCINALGLTYGQMYGSSEERESLTDYKWGSVSKEIRTKYKKLENDYMTAREVLCVIGSDIMRAYFNKDVWAIAGVKSVINSSTSICIVTDLRMQNELEISLELPPKYNFDKPKIVRIYRETGLEDMHFTETELDVFDSFLNQRSLVPRDGYDKLTERLWRKASSNCPFDYLLDNNGSLEEMENNCKLILKEIGV